MYKQYFVSSFFLLLFNFLNSQEYTLSGTLADTDSQPISYANILLLKVSDSTVYKGTSSNEQGKFLFNNISSDSYLLQVSFVGFNDYQKALTITNDHDLEVIILEEATETLNEVEIIAKKPTLKKESDRLVFNVENTALTEGSIWDVLKGTPGILMINDEVTVKNSGNVIYLINGKRVYLNDNELQQLLSGTNANAVQSIEVITNPPAKYDASGGAVINITMSKNLVAGYNGNLYGNYTQGIYPRYNVGTGHFFKGEKLNVYLGYSYDYKKVNRFNREDILFTENATTTGAWQSDIDRNTKSKTHNVSANVDYDIDENNTLSFSANTTITPYWKRNLTSVTESVDSTFHTGNVTSDDTKNLAINVGYQNVTKKGNTFSTNFNYTTNDYERSQDVSTDYYDTNGAFYRNNAFIANSLQDVDIFTGQVDYSLSFKDESTLEFGGKLSLISSDNDFKQYLTNNTTQFNIDNSGVFNYSEAIYAAYLSYAKSWDKWDLSLGLRSEYTEGQGDLVNVEVNDFNYFKLFPTFNLTRIFNDKHTLGISYSKRISRPGYSELNPFQFYLNDNTFVEGNPNLQPTITQLGTLSYTLNQTFTFEVYYRYEENTISELTFLDNDNKTVRYQSANLKHEIDYGFDFLTYKSITDFWSFYIVNSIYYDEAQFFAEESGNVIQENSRWSLYNNIINYFSLGNNFDADLSFLYFSPMIEGSADVSSRMQVDINAKKSFNNGKWILSLTLNDIFNTTDFTVKNNYLNQRNRYHATFDNQWVRVGLRYNFGNTKLQTNQGTSTQAEQDRIKTRD